MKKLNLIILFCLALSTFAQAQIPPQAFNYSAVARDVAGVPISNSTIGIQISILKTSTVGSVQYSENHFVNTDEYGLFNLIIGAGAVQNGSISSIEWSADNYFLNVGMDVNGGTNFLTMGTTQLLSVPYALHAATADSIIGGVAGFSGNYNDLTNLPDLSNINTDNQQLSVSVNGDTLFLQNGGFVIIPGISAANNTGGGNGIYSPGNGVTDIDGNNYTSIIINGQEWMSENLRTSRYSNGDTIPNVIDETQWSNLFIGAWVNYNNDNSYENPYGKLYNWYTCVDLRNVCPTGWHVSTDTEWNNLSDYIGGYSVAGSKLKSTGVLDDGSGLWTSPNLATNQSGFSGHPGGSRAPDGVFQLLTVHGDWWTSTEFDGVTAYFRYMGNSYVDLSGGNSDKKYGLSIRCVKD